MKHQEALADCEATVRRFDPDRYFASLFAPAAKRRLLFVLYAFNHEIARAVEVAREPMMAEIRLQWWREALDEARAGRPRAPPVASGLSELIIHAQPADGALEALIDARANEISSAPFADLAALESHLEATSGALMRIAASLLEGAATSWELTREAGIAYGLAGTIRSIPFQAARGRTFLPADLISAAGNAEAILQVARAARNHFERARSLTVPSRVVPAILPASLVPAYLSRVVRRDGGDVSLLRRQLILFRAATLGRL